MTIPLSGVRVLNHSNQNEMNNPLLYWKLIIIIIIIYFTTKELELIKCLNRFFLNIWSMILHS